MLNLFQHHVGSKLVEIIDIEKQKLVFAHIEIL